LEAAHALLGGPHSTLNEIDVLRRQAQLSVSKGDLEAARRLASELEALKIGTVRPDLKEEFQRLVSRVGQPPSTG
jgi:hypothetical protein